MALVPNALCPSPFLIEQREIAVDVGGLIWMIKNRF